MKAADMAARSRKTVDPPPGRRHRRASLALPMLWSRRLRERDWRDRNDSVAKREPSLPSPRSKLHFFEGWRLRISIPGKGPVGGRTPRAPMIKPPLPSFPAGSASHPEIANPWIGICAVRHAFQPAIEPAEAELKEAWGEAAFQGSLGAEIHVPREAETAIPVRPGAKDESERSPCLAF